MCIMVFPIFQRYNFESKSQLTAKKHGVGIRCFRYFKDTILKANHNSFGIHVAKLAGVSDISKIQF